MCLLLRPNLVCEYFYCNKVCCHPVVNIMLIVIVCFGWFFGCFNSRDLNIVTLLQLYKKNQFTQLL